MALHTRMTRRRWFSLTGGALGVAALADIGALAGQPDDRQSGRLTARPRDRVTTSLATGPLGLGDGGRDGVIQMPSALPEGKMPLLVFLHGAGQSGQNTLRRISAAAAEAGIAVVAPDSRGRTWDAIGGEFGEDVTFLNRTLEYIFGRLDVDPARLTVGGFSDGASYALSLGLVNGDVFPRVLACSPGFIVQGRAHGRPRMFVSHGTSDQILPIDRCSRVIVPRLRAMRYEVTYREFEGRHELPPGIAGDAMRWIAAA